MLEEHHNKILSSMIEHIRAFPDLRKQLDGKIIQIEDSEVRKQHKEKIVNVIKNVTHIQIYSSSPAVYSSDSKIYYLKMCFNNTYYQEYSYMFGLWKTTPEKCSIFFYLNKAFKNVIEYWIGEVKTKICGVFIPEDKSLHKLDVTRQFYIDNIKSLNIQTNSQPFTGICKSLIRSLENNEHGEVIHQTRSLIESYHKHFLNKANIDNSKVVVEVLNNIEIIPDYLQQQDPSIQIQIKEIISSLNSIMTSIGTLRNNQLISASHGQGRNAASLEENHTYLIVGAALAYINFISKSKPRQV